MPFIHAAAPFAIIVRHEDSVATVAVLGELDIATAPRLSAALGEHGDAQMLVVDLTAASFIDSTGVRLLVEAERRCAGSGRRLVVLVDDGPVLRVLELCELDRLMSVVGPSPARRA